MAMGNGTSTPGVNHKLLPFLQARKGKRVGIVCTYIYIQLNNDRRRTQLFALFCIIVLDFYDAVPGLVEAVIGL
jgi:1-phosphatidylinositol phosphodiesterase